MHQCRRTVARARREPHPWRDDPPLPSVRAGCGRPRWECSAPRRRSRVTERRGSPDRGTSSVSDQRRPDRLNALRRHSRLAQLRIERPALAIRTAPTVALAPRPLPASVRAGYPRPHALAKPRPRESSDLAVRARRAPLPKNWSTENGNLIARTAQRRAPSGRTLPRGAVVEREQSRATSLLSRVGRCASVCPARSGRPQTMTHIRFSFPIDQNLRGERRQRDRPPTTRQVPRRAGRTSRQVRPGIVRDARAAASPEARELVLPSPIARGKTHCPLR